MRSSAPITQEGATPGNGGKPAPRYSDRVESTFAALDIPADLVDTFRQLPPHKREEVERDLVPGLETVVIAFVTNASPGDMDHDALRRRYPPDVARALIIGVETGRKIRREEAG
jgi:hypothetical protein